MSIDLDEPDTEAVATGDAHGGAESRTLDGRPDLPAWLGAVPEELTTAARKFKDPEAMLRSYVSLEQKMGRSVELPNKDAGPEEIERFYSCLGRPETPDGYDVRRPDLPDALAPTEADAAREKSFLTAMHKSGATPAAVQAAFDWYYDQARALLESGRAAAEEESQAREAELRRVWGRDYERNNGLAKRALREFAGPAGADRLSALMGQAEVLRIFAKIGQRIGEDAMVTSEAMPDSADGLRKELDALYKSRDYWTNEDTQKRVRALNKVLAEKSKNKDETG